TPRQKGGASHRGHTALLPLEVPRLPLPLKLSRYRSAGLKLFDQRGRGFVDLDTGTPTPMAARTPHRGIQWGHTLRVLGVDIRVMSDEILDDLIVAEESGAVQGRLPMAVMGIDVSARLDKQIDRGDLVRLRFESPPGINFI